MLNNIRKHKNDNDGVEIILPNKEILKSSHSANLNLPMLSDIATTAHIVPGLRKSLLAFGPLCDDGCEIRLTKSLATVVKNDKVIMTGTRSGKNQLWFMDLNSNIENISNNAVSESLHAVNISTHYIPEITQKSIKSKLKWFVGAMGNPVKTTFKNAIKKEWLSLPGVSATNIEKHVEDSIYTVTGHSRLINQHANIINPFQTTIDKLDPNMVHDILVKMVKRKLPVVNRTHVDATGSRKLKNGVVEYDVIFYNSDSDYIHVETTRTLNEAAYLKICENGVNHFKQFNINIRIMRFDNSISPLVKNFLKFTKQIEIELVPVDNHRANKAERSIQTWKNHRIASLASCDPQCPDSCFIEMNEQLIMTMNMMRESAITDKLSAYQQLHGNYDYSNNPIAPLGMKVEVYRSKASRDTTWSNHTFTGFYVGPALEHHKCFRVYNPLTKRVIITDSLNWFPINEFKLETSTPADDILTAIGMLERAVTNIYLPTHDSEMVTDAVTDNLIKNIINVKKLFTGTNEYNEGDNTNVTEPTATTTVNRDNITTNMNLRSNNKIKTVNFVKIDDDIPNETFFNQNKNSDGNNTWYKNKIFDTTNTSINSFMNNVIKINEHRKSKDAIGQYEFNITWSGPANEKSWIQLNDNNKYIRQHQAFLNYLTKTKDIKMLKSFSDRSFDDKLLFANNIQANKTTTISPLKDDHHGLKYLDNGKPLRYSKAVKSADSSEWIKAHSDELDRLINRRKRMRFIHKHEKEHGRVVSYWNPQLTVKMKNNIKDLRIRGTVGGDVNDYTGNTSAYTASLPTVKLLLNAVVSDPNSKFMTIDAKDFFLHGSSGRNEYMRIPLSFFSEEDFSKYNIKSFIQPNDTSVLVEIYGNMYGLVNAAYVAQKDLVSLLSSNGFVETKTPQLYKHISRNIQFSLVVDDFGVKYNDKTDADYLIQILQKEYELTIDWVGKLYLGMTIDLDRSNKEHTITLSMPGYIQRLLHRLDLGPYKTNTNSPMQYNSHWNKEEINPENNDYICAEKVHLLKMGVGGFLYYARAIGYDYMTTVCKFSSKQAKPTLAVWEEFLHFLNYAHTWSESKLVFKASDMILILDADVSYLSEDGAKSRGGGVAYLGKKNDSNFINGAIDVMSVLLPTIVSSVCEGEVAAGFLLAQLAMPFRVNLYEMGYPQDRTLLTTDNQCAEGIANKSIKLKRSKAMDMRYFWLRDRVEQGDFQVKWRRNTQSLADFFTKTLPTKEFLEMRKKFIFPGQIKFLSFATQKSKNKGVT